MRLALATALLSSLIVGAAPAGVLTVPTGGWGIKEAGPAAPSAPGSPREATLSKD